MKQKLLYFFIGAFCFTQLILAQSANEKTAENWIKQNTKSLEIQSNHDFKMLFNRKGPAGETLRFYQMVNGVQVLGAELTIHISPKGDVDFHQSTYDKKVAVINTVPSITKEAALEKAKRKLKVKGNISIQDVKLYVYNKLDQTRLVYRVLTKSEFLNGYWETIVDAKSGNILGTKDIAKYCFHNKDKDKNKGKKKEIKKSILEKGNPAISMMASGTGMVFNPDPLGPTAQLYAGNYVDNNDATNTQLDAAREAVTLIDIDFTGGQYTLKGQYAEIKSFGAPNTGLFKQASSAFNFNRNEQGFEAVTVYYHVDKSMRYINETLGITLVSTYNSGVVHFDPHGHNGDDQSTYGGGQLEFGEGGVDDGEDSDVILHELGHGLHDWANNGAGISSQTGEGFGDYWAMSYKRSLGHWQPSDPSYHYVFGWDGHNPFWNGRVTNTTDTYPSGITGGTHNDGQIISAALMQIWDAIGKTKTDAAFLEGMAMTNGSTNQKVAATAIRLAAKNMAEAGTYGMTCADVDQMTTIFNARGYTLPVLACTPLAISEFEIKNISISPNPATNSITFKNIAKEYTIEVFNIIGQKVMDQKVDPNNNKIDVTNIANGAYILKLKDYSGALKFIKL